MKPIKTNDMIIPIFMITSCLLVLCSIPFLVAAAREHQQMKNKQPIDDDIRYERFRSSPFFHVYENKVTMNN